VGKNKDKEIAQMMKEKFRLVTKLWGYDINSIDEQGVHFIMHILAGKIMRKCKANEATATIVSLVVQGSNLTGLPICARNF